MAAELACHASAGISQTDMALPHKLLCQFVPEKLYYPLQLKQKFSIKLCSVSGVAGP